MNTRKSPVNWLDHEITNEDSLHIDWKLAKLINMDHDVEDFLGKGARNYAFVQKGPNAFILLVASTLATDRTCREVLLSAVERRSSTLIEKHVVAPSVLKVVLEKLSKKNSGDATPKRADSDTIRAFNDIVCMAAQLDSSDIHFRGDRRNPRVEFRVLGTIRNSGLQLSYDRMQELLSAQYQTQAEENSNTGSALTFRTQQRAAFPINIEINDKPQSLKLRFEVTNSSSGFHSAMRIAWMSGDKVKKGESLEHDLLKRGYHADQAEMISAVAYKDGGGMVIAGATGSGKTQTLYNIMRWISTHENIAITVEDPIEGDLEIPTQIPVVRREGQTLDEAIGAIIKAILRLDPDIALISEIRGREAGSGFQQLVQAGHKTLTTVHADSPIEIYERLVSDEIGVDRSVLSTPDKLTLGIYQRLVQVLCPYCGINHSKAGVTAKYMRDIERATGVNDLSLVRFRNESGCEACNAVSPIPGVIGREVAASVWLPDDETLLLLRSKLVTEAVREFQSRRKAIDDPGTDGCSAAEVGMQKMLLGRVSPREIGAFEPFGLYADKQAELSRRIRKAASGAVLAVVPPHVAGGS